MSTLIRKRISGDRRRGSLSHLVRTRSGGNGRALAPMVQRSFFRNMSCVGPQAPVGFEDSTWTYGSSPPNGEIGWRVYFDHSAPWTYLTTFPPHYHWVRKMAPMRFRIDSLRDEFDGIGTLELPKWFETDVANIGHRSQTPPEESHLRELQVTSASFPLRGLWHNAYNIAVDWTTEPSVTHYRILVDGIDQTGVVAFGSPLPLSINTGVGVPRIFTGLPTDFLPFTAAHDQTIEIDFWVLVDTAGGPYAENGADQEWPVCRTDMVAAFTRAEMRANVRDVRGTYQLTFSDGGPQPSIILNEQPGWTYTSDASSRTLSNAEWSISLDWSREYAQVRVVQYSQYNVPTGGGGGMIYLPANSGHYEGLEFRSGLIVQPGVWNSQGSTVFSIRQRQMQPTFYSSQNATEHGETWLPSSYFTGFPSAVTVERV